MSAKNLRLRSCVGAILAGATIGSVLAAEEKTAALEEVVVTAERRAQSLQEVPLSITAFSDQVRDRIGIQTIQDMANFAPGFSYNTSTDRPSIRGVARQTNIVTIESPVANYIDGVYTSTVQDAQRRPIFIERTEILRGPQGALSGRGSIAGAINTISKHPSDAFGGEVRTFGGTYSRWGAEGTVTGPVTDWLRVRANYGTYHQNTGYFENVSNGQHEGNQPNNRLAADLLLDMDLGASVDWFIKASYVDYDETRRTAYSTAPFVAGTIGAPSPYGPTTGTLVPVAAYGYFPASNSTRVGTATENPVITTGDVRKFVSDYRSNQGLTTPFTNYTTSLTWRASGLDVKYTAGLQKYTYQQNTEGDGTDVLSMQLPPATGAPTRIVYPGQVNTYIEDRKYYSHELTFTSTTEGIFSWIGGLYYSREEDHQEPLVTTLRGYDELTRPFGTLDLLLQSLGQPFNAANAARAVVANPRPNVSTSSLIDGDFISKAAYGQVDFKLSDQWKVTVGGRYNRDDKTATEQLRLIANNLGAGLAPFLAGGRPILVNGVPVLGPKAVDVTPIPTAGAALPDGVIRDRGIDPVTGYRVRDFDKSWHALTGSVGVDFQPTKEDLIYLRIAKGYRPGGFNTGSILNLATVDQEKVISYETGYKTTLFNRLQIDASVFYYNYRDIQLPLSTLANCTVPGDLSTCQSINTFVNLPSGESKGFELEATYAPIDELSLYLSYGYLSAKIKDGISSNNGFSNPDDPAAVLSSANRYAAIPGQLDTGFTGLQRYTQDLSGNSLANSPKHRVAFNADYGFNFDAGKLSFSASYVWRSEQFSDVFETQESKVPSYSTIGLRILWSDSANRYTVIAYGSNLSDSQASDGATVTRVRTGLTGVAGAAYYRNVNLSPPREYGVEIQYRLGGAAK
jgi:iron complex outermembrane recepter protein